MHEFFTYIQEFFVDFFLILNEMSPYLLLGLFFAGLLKVFLPETFIAKYLQKSNTRSAINATLLGVPLPLCSCGVLPTGIALYKNGASKGATNAFITSTPQTGVDSILVTYAMLGLPMAIIRPIVALISGVLSGIITNKLTQNEQTNTSQTAKAKISCATEKPNLKTKWLAVFRYAFLTFLSDIARWLVIGTLIAALISVLLPSDFFTAYITTGIVGIVVILFASMPLYICATASVPIAAILLSKGISPGAILVFLMAGPATNAASFTLIGKTLGKKSLLAYLVTIVTSAVGFGLLIDAFLPTEWFQILNIGTMENCETNSLKFWLQTLSSAILIGLIAYIYIQKNKEKNRKMTIQKDERIYSVPDVSCNHCKKALEGAFNTLPNIEKVEVNLAHKSVIIKGLISDEEITKIVTEQGFTFEGKAEK